MRFDCSELPLFVIMCCQFPPWHLGPPRHSLSFNVKVTGTLDSTAGTLHMSIPEKPSLSLSEWAQEPQDQAVLTTYLITLWPHPLVWCYRSIWSWSCYYAANAGGLGWSWAKSHLHESSCFERKCCKCGHASCVRGGKKRWQSSLWNFLQVFFLPVLWLQGKQLPPTESMSPRLQKDNISNLSG